MLNLVLENDNLIARAYAFASLKHKEQKYGKKPYIIHLLDVFSVARRFVDWDQLYPEFINACILHDVVEDTDCSYDELMSLFGYKTAELVWAVTNEPGQNRKERAIKTYPKIINTEHALRLKLCDRIANLENTVSHDRRGRRPQKIFLMYERERFDFESTLRSKCFSESEIEKNMWIHLEKLFIEGREKIQFYETNKLV